MKKSTGTMINTGKIKIIFWLAFGALCLPQLVVAEPTHNFGSHGYLRAGSGFSEGDSSHETFKAPGAGAKYRLGNESDNYIEFDLFDTYELNKEEGGPFIHAEGMAIISGASNESLDFDDMAQLFFEAGNFTSSFGNPKIWIGRRYYDRHDIHINDFFFLNTLQGFDGGGITGLDFGVGKLAVAFGRDKSESIAGDDIHQTNVDVRWSDIPLNKNGELMLWGLYSASADNDEVESTNGWGIGIMHTQADLWGGYNKFMLQYGSGLARNAGVSGVDASVGSVTSSAMADDLDEARTVRVTNQTVIEPSDKWAVMTVLIYEDKESKDFDNTDQTWLSVGARPMWFVNDHFRIPLEVGYDYVDNKATGSEGSLLKTTLAAEFALKPGFWTRPVLRAYGTYAKWSDDFKGQIGGETFAEETDGWTAGVQIETWW